MSSGRPGDQYLSAGLEALIQIRFNGYYNNAINVR